MHRGILRRLITASLLVLVVTPLLAQTPKARLNARQQQQLQQRIQQQMKEAAENAPVLPSDPQLLQLHKEFIAKAEKLGLEFERKKQLGQAREVYESLIRLVPKYAQAEAGLQRILGKQSAEDKKLTEVDADKAWQDSGVALQKGMPVKIELKGTWKVVIETGPAGIEIPEKMRPRDSRIKLGTLIGVLATSPADLTEGKPFILESGKEFIAPKSGRLYLRMFDLDPSDNEGKMLVLIQSTFLN